MQEKGRETWVIGHKNPDTDSICSAIAYARLKTLATGETYVPRRAGHVNQETSYVLKRFGARIPEFTGSVRTQVSDLEIRRTPGVEKSFSLKKAWALMHTSESAITLPVLEGEKLIGIITVGDIATSYMDVTDNRILGLARTPYRSIAETLEGEMVVGDPEGCVTSGKVVIATASPDQMEQFVEEGDLVILGNRYENQLCAAELGAGCLILCDNAPVSRTIRMLAAEKGCRVLVTPYDPYTAARFLNLSIPIEYFMRSEKLDTFHMDDFAEDIREVMAKKRHRYFPVLDENEVYRGMVSRRNFLGMHGKRVILVDHNERSQAVDGIEEAEILEIIDHHRIGSMMTMEPIFFRNQPLGCTATIVTEMYEEAGLTPEKDIAGLLLSAILSDTLIFRSPTCTPKDTAAAEKLAAIAGVNAEELGREMFRAGSDLALKSEKEIFYQDYKEFSFGDLKAGIGQVASMNDEELSLLKETMAPYLEKARVRQGVDAVYFALTSVPEGLSRILCCGPRAEQLLRTAFPDAEKTDGAYVLPGVMSRKKQLVPALYLAAQQ